MGSSVIHGAMSTFLAIMALNKAEVYSVVLFYKCWVCIIVFGLLNGLVLLPVILSFVGPVDFKIKEEETTSNELKSELKKEGMTTIEEIRSEQGTEEKKIKIECIES
jgi:hypothetical protein